MTSTTVIQLSQLFKVSHGRYQIRTDLTAPVEIQQGAKLAFKNTADTLHLTQAELLDIASLCGQKSFASYSTGTFIALEGPADATFKYYEAGNDMLRTKLWIYDNTRIILEQEPISGFSVKAQMELSIADILALMKLIWPIQPGNGHDLMDCPSSPGACLQWETDKDYTVATKLLGAEVV